MTDVYMAKPIAPRFLVKCEVCGRDLDSSNKRGGVFQHGEGWMELRADGGAHSMALPKRSNRWMCGKCITTASKGHTNQSNMF
jgi:hypothetical protein